MSRPNSPYPKLPRVGLCFRSQLSLNWHNFDTATKGGGGNGNSRQSFRPRLRAPFPLSSCPHHVLASPKSPMQRPVWCVSGEMLHVWTQALPTGRSIIAYMTFDGREDLKKSYCLVKNFRKLRRCHFITVYGSFGSVAMEGGIGH